MLGKFTFVQQVVYVYWYCKGDILYIFNNLLALIPKLKVIKCPISQSVMIFMDKILIRKYTVSIYNRYNSILHIKME